MSIGCRSNYNHSNIDLTPEEVVAKFAQMLSPLFVAIIFIF